MRLQPYLRNLEKLLVERALTAVAEAEKQLTDLSDLSQGTDENEIFNELMTFAGYAFRRSISARTLFLRHTPTLMGFPRALDPLQNHLLNPGNHIIDYARNAYLQFQEARSGSPREFQDNPFLRTAAKSMCETLYQRTPLLQSVLFSSAMGAIGGLIDYVVMTSRDTDRHSLIGKRCWFEIWQYASERYPRSFQPVDEHDTQRILDAIENPQIAAIILEPIGNHPDMAVIDLEEIAEKLHSTTFDAPKLIVFDTVHTPELDIFARYFHESLPDNLCIALVISGVKFMQAGWDLSKSGLVTLRCGEGQLLFENRTVYEKLIEIRSVSGRAPSIEEALLADIETADSFRSRIGRYDTNTAYFARSLDAWLRKMDLGYISSPWLPSHDRHEMALSTYGTGGRILFIYLNGRYFDESALGVIFKDLAQAAEDEGISLITAPSFGMASPHIHIVIRPGLPTTLRISTGSTNRTTVERLLQLICAHLGGYRALA
jgi:cystathionine beta-lyase/cystathionine gamma-synthase